MNQSAFIFNTNLCTGCSACAIACQIENQLLSVQSPELPRPPAWRNVYTFNPSNQPEFPGFHLSVACNHCVDPACLASCPAAAYAKDPLTGAVTIDPARCIGCHYCSWACPFDAPKFNPATKTMEKCTFCNDRLRAGSEPACVKACPTDALKIGLLGDDASGMSATHSGFPRTTIKPAVRFVPFRSPIQGQPASAASFTEKISFRQEWPLWLLTSVVTLLFACFAGLHPAWHAKAYFLDLALIGSGGAAMLISTLHLGKPLRAWRAVLNLQTSWLSREIFFISVFLAGAALVFGVVSPYRPDILASNAWLLQASFVVAGLCTLVSIDRVYDVAQFKGAEESEIYRSRPRLHSASSLLGGLYLAGIASSMAAGFSNPYLTESLVVVGLGASLVQICEYVDRRYKRPSQSWAGGTLVSLRVIVGFALPWFWLLVSPGGWLPFICAGLGFVIDRYEFYNDLAIPAPGWH